MGCDAEISAVKKSGADIYPHRPDLVGKSFYQCNDCKNFVGCHPGSNNKPLGCIATPEVKNARRKIHLLLDSLWHTKSERSDIFFGARCVHVF